jgi:hypothetical protein
MSSTKFLYAYRKANPKISNEQTSSAAEMLCVESVCDVAAEATSVDTVW